VDVIDTLLANNQAFADWVHESLTGSSAASATSQGGQRAPRHLAAVTSLPPALDIHPALKLAIVTCMDSRLNVFEALGLGDGQAHVLRNAGGVITDDVIRSLAVSQRTLGTRSVMLIHHTDCGLQKLTEDGFRGELQADIGEAPPFAIESFKDVDANVAQSILRVRRSRFIPHREDVRGFVYDVASYRLREIDAPGDA
jgi:carbonic anhydrase